MEKYKDDYHDMQARFCLKMKFEAVHLLAYLHKDASVDGESAPLAEVPCFLPVVPRRTSWRPDLFQHMEYLSKTTYGF